MDGFRFFHREAFSIGRFSVFVIFADAVVSNLDPLIRVSKIVMV